MQLGNEHGALIAICCSVKCVKKKPQLCSRMLSQINQSKPKELALAALFQLTAALRHQKSSFQILKHQSERGNVGLMMLNQAVSVLLLDQLIFVQTTERC